MPRHRPRPTGRARRHLERNRDDVRALRRARHRRRSLPVRRRRRRRGRRRACRSPPDRTRSGASTVEGVGPGQLYGLPRARPLRAGAGTPLQPRQAAARSLRARAERVGALELGAREPSGRAAGPAVDLSADPRDSAGAMPKCVVVDPAFDWTGDERPAHAVGAHGHLRVPREGHDDAAPGGAPGAARHLSRALQRADPRAPALARRHGRRAAPGAPGGERAAPGRPGPRQLLGLQLRSATSRPTCASPPPATAARSTEFKAMVRRLPRGGARGAARRRLQPHRRRRPSRPDAGVPRHRQRRLLPARPGAPRPLPRLHRLRQHARPPARRRRCDLVLDSLRYWVEEMHVDGFRFDIAPVLGRAGSGVRSGRAVLPARGARSGAVGREADRRAVGPRARTAISVGAFPRGWAEWNGKFRDGARRFWRGDTGAVGELASRLSGSSDLFATGDRGPLASVNFVTCHDGFTLHDLVSYEHKHNEANGEGNRDGTDYNLSRNWGVEGPADHHAGGARARAGQAQPARDAGLLAGRARCCPTATSSAAPSTATTTPTATTGRSPGSTGTSTPAQEALLAVHPGGAGHPRRHAGAAPQHLLSGRAGGGARAHLARRGRGADDGRRLGPRVQSLPGHAVRRRLRRSCSCSTAAAGRAPSRCPSSPEGPGPSWSTRPTKASARSRPASRSRPTRSSFSGTPRSRHAPRAPSLPDRPWTSATRRRGAPAGAPDKDAAVAEDRARWRGASTSCRRRSTRRGGARCSWCCRGATRRARTARSARCSAARPPGRHGRQLQGALADRAGARLPLAGAPGRAAARDDRRLQPLALRGRAGGARPRAGARGGLARRATSRSCSSSGI